MTIDYSKLVKEYKPQMTESERMDKYFKGEKVDHIPFILEGFDMPFWHNLGYTTKEVNEDFELFTKLLDKKFKEYDLNGIAIGYNLQNFGEILGSKLKIPNEGASRIVEYALKDGIDLDKIEVPTRSNNQGLEDLFQEGKKLKEVFPDQDMGCFIVGPISLAAELRPVEKLLRDLRKSPKQALELINFCTEAAISFVREFTQEFGSSQVYIPDPVSSQDLLSFDQFKEFSYPYQEKLINELVSITGQKPILHICGHTKEFWPYLYKLDIDAFSVDNCEDLEETKKSFGEKMIIIGNVPPTSVMRLGSPEDVVEAVKKCIKKAADSPNGYIINQGCDTPIGTPQENIDAYIYAVRKYGANAVKGKVPEAVYQD